jgi:hypothetical protein
MYFCEDIGSPPRTLVHPRGHWFTPEDIGSPTRTLVHPQGHWFTPEDIGSPSRTLVHPRGHWFTHEDIGSPTRTLVHPRGHWFTPEDIGSPPRTLVHPRGHWFSVLSELVGLRNIATDEWQKDYWKSEVNIFFVEFCLTNDWLIRSEDHYLSELVERDEYL